MPIAYHPSSRTIPNYVRSRTPEGVRNLLAQRQAALGGHLRPLGSPTQARDGYWYLWYLEDVDLDLSRPGEEAK